ncbi:rhodanese-like domain-containing protein [Prochlorococcus marinus]|uniref:rhodanese-like domain-containing protein n=1 Tax=Prochlorococcus marinus TaxID=1219 RepID=UPI0022B3B4ED|nr:rhodanese-like domain-containing protein [Prochlorococcus marinus]
MNQKTPQNLTPRQLEKWLQDKDKQPLLVDVREQAELDIAAFPSPIVHLPLSQASVWTTSLKSNLSFKKPIVALCHSGIRSWNFALWLIEQDDRYNVWNLEGGIDAWSMQIDDSVPRY